MEVPENGVEKQDLKVLLITLDESILGAACMLVQQIRSRTEKEREAEAIRRPTPSRSCAATMVESTPNAIRNSITKKQSKTSIVRIQEDIVLKVSNCASKGDGAMGQRR
jgi:hypothetical protein